SLRLEFAPPLGRGVCRGTLRVAFLSSEAVPFAKTGGLGDVAGALPKALVGEGLDVSIIHPLYDTTDRRLLREQVFDNIEVEWLGERRRVSLPERRRGRARVSDRRAG